jgi:hypothetical protein
MLYLQINRGVCSAHGHSASNDLRKSIEIEVLKLLLYLNTYVEIQATGTQKALTKTVR